MWPNGEMNFYQEVCKIWVTVLQKVKVVRPQCADFCCSDTCQMLVSWEVVRSREVYYTENVLICIQIQLCEEKAFSSFTVTGWVGWGVLAESCFSPVSLSVNSWWVAVCGQSTRVLRPAASRHPPDTGLSYSSGRCAAARWRSRTLAWPGKGRRTGGWRRAGGCPGLSSCRQVGAPQRWWTSRGRGSGERSLCLPHMTPASNSAVKTGKTGRVCEKRWFICSQVLLRFEHLMSLHLQQNDTVSIFHTFTMNIKNLIFYRAIWLTESQFGK